MGRVFRGAVPTLGLTLVLTSCGLAAFATPALAPEVAARPLVAPAAAAQPDPAPARAETPLMPKVTLPQSPAVVAKAVLPAADLGDVRHLWQSLNNCGPASVVMVLSTFGVNADQRSEERRVGKECRL